MRWLVIPWDWQCASSPTLLISCRFHIIWYRQVDCINHDWNGPVQSSTVLSTTGNRKPLCIDHFDREVIRASSISLSSRRWPIISIKQTPPDSYNTTSTSREVIQQQNDSNNQDLNGEMQPAGQFVILYMLAMMVVSLLLMWGIRYLFSTFEKTDLFAFFLRRDIRGLMLPWMVGMFFALLFQVTQLNASQLLYTNLLLA